MARPSQATRFFIAAIVMTTGHAGSAVAQKVPAAIDCTANRLEGAEKETCASPDLMRLTASVDSATKALEATLTGRNKDMLLDTEEPFAEQRSDCDNLRPDPSDVHKCIANILNHRLQALAKATAAPNSIRGELTEYRFLDVPYAIKWGDLLLRERVQVWGCLNKRSPLGVIISQSCSNTEPYVQAVYSDVQAGAVSGLRDDPLMGYWRGVLQRGHDDRVTLRFDP